MPLAEYVSPTITTKKQCGKLENGSNLVLCENSQMTIARDSSDIFPNQSFADDYTGHAPSTMSKKHLVCCTKVYSKSIDTLCKILKYFC